jgi:hypothetical protein
MTDAITPLILHEDTFYEFFVPYRHPKAAHDIWGGHGLETYGDDLELVRSLDQNHVWTVVESGCDDDFWITPGFHYVNRICYLVTEKAHNGLVVDFRAPRKMRSLTPLGLKRQLTKIKHSLNQLKPVGAQ